MKKLLIALFVLINFCAFSPALADEPLTDWVIRDFHSDITLNKDSSLTIVEKITADCGSLPNKHGIFRILPLEYQKTSTDKVKTPIELVSITNFNDNPIKYSTTKQDSGGINTITWKIGDANATVTGLNYYKITYKIQNTIRYDNSSFDELYWNLSGNFWQIPINNFSATIHFPSEINQNNTSLSFYSGVFGDKGDNGITKKWSNKNTLEITYGSVLENSNGVTLSATFPKNIETPYKFSFWDVYGGYFYFLIPIIVFIVCYLLWKKYGKDPKINSAIIPEFEIPNNFSPLLIGLVESNGSMNNKIFPAEIINLATKKIIKVEQTQEKSLLHEADYALILQTDKFDNLSWEEKLFLNQIFVLMKKDETVLLSSFKNKFYRNAQDIKNKIVNQLVLDSYLLTQGTKLKTILITIAMAIFFVLFQFLGEFLVYSMSLLFWTSFILSIIIVIVFAILMPSRTDRGAELEHRIKGFKMYMETAEKYRSQFNEKENIFEKFLPYAIMFGMTKKWINSMKNIYGEKYISSYHPVWFYGIGGSAFDFNTFSDNIESVSAQMATTMASNPSSSGSGGGGFSGGGGGGGGGGGW